MKRKKDKTIDNLIKQTDVEYVNKLLKNSNDLKDFEISKSTLSNISSWALDGHSDKEIRDKLDLNKHQWAILVTICPSLIMIMEHSRAMADLVIAGSLFQTAIGGKRIKKQVAVKVKDYDFDGKGKSWVIGEHTEVMEIEEELPPNPMLLKFLAEKKLSEQFGDNKSDKNDRIKEMVDSLSEKDKALIKMAMEKEVLNGEN